MLGWGGRGGFFPRTGAVLFRLRQGGARLLFAFRAHFPRANGTVNVQRTISKLMATARGENRAARERRTRARVGGKEEGHLGTRSMPVVAVPRAPERVRSGDALFSANGRGIKRAPK